MSPIQINYIFISSGSDTVGITRRKQITALVYCFLKHETQQYVETTQRSSLRLRLLFEFAFVLELNPEIQHNLQIIRISKD